MFGESKVNPYELSPKDMRQVLPPNSAMAIAGESKANAKWIFQCRLFDIASPPDRKDYESLINRIGNDDPEIQYISEQGTFGRESNYLIMMKWFKADTGDQYKEGPGNAEKNNSGNIT